MLPSFSRGLRLALVLALSVGYVVWHGHRHPAYAKGGGDNDEEGDDDDSKGGKDEPDESDDGAEDDKDQPPVTAGGLFTINTYPVREISRPLTMTEKVTQLKVSLGTDLSAKGAFATGGLSLEGVHGFADNFSLIGGLTDAYNFKQFSLYLGFEGALAYDLLDVRLAANFHRFAIPRFCGSDPQAPTTCDATTAALPSGNYDAAGTQFSIDFTGGAPPAGRIDTSHQWIRGRVLLSQHGHLRDPSGFCVEYSLAQQLVSRRKLGAGHFQHQHLHELQLVGLQRVPVESGRECLVSMELAPAERACRLHRAPDCARWRRRWPCWRRRSRCRRRQKIPRCGSSNSILIAIPRWRAR
jgi:hypothetical protein